MHTHTLTTHAQQYRALMRHTLAMLLRIEREAMARARATEVRAIRIASIAVAVAATSIMYAICVAEECE